MAKILVFFELALIIDRIAAWDHVITLYERNGTSYKIVRRCAAAPAAFGTHVDNEMIACPVFPQPKDGCSKIEPPPRFVNSSERYLCVNYVALLERGTCTYANKVFLGQEAGYQAVIIYDNEFDDGPTAMGKDGVYDNRINIPSVFITKSCGLFIKNYSQEIGTALLISRFPVDFTQYLMPFVVVLGGCLFLAVVALAVKYVKDKRQEWRRRLSRRKLKRLPTKKYKKSKNEESPETCPICLEDFDDGDRLRILPCNHWYHLKCVDPWLTKNRKICPVCKRKVLKDDSDSDTSSSSAAALSENGRRRPGTSATPDDVVDETSPLLTSQEQTLATARDFTNGSATPTGNYGSTNESFLTASESTTSTNNDDDSLDGLTFADVQTPTQANVERRNVDGVSRANVGGVSRANVDGDRLNVDGNHENVDVNRVNVSGNRLNVDGNRENVGVNSQDVSVNRLIVGVNRLNVGGNRQNAGAVNETFVSDNDYDDKNVEK